jgi:hypothetical protein
VTLEVAVVAHHQREDMAVELADKVGAAMIVWDKGHGPRDTHERAWRELALLAPTGRHHRESWWGMVIEDDAIPVADFRQCMRSALVHAPSSVVSAYLGRGRPANWQHSIAQVMAIQCDWLTARAVLHGVGIAVRGTRIADLVKRCAPEDQSWGHQVRRWRIPMDEAMDQWVRDRKITVAYSHPSLLDHDPHLPSIIGPDRHRTHAVRVPAALGAHLDPDYRRAWHVHPQRQWGNTLAPIPIPELPTG